MLNRRDAHQYENKDKQKPVKDVCLSQCKVLEEPSIVSTTNWIFEGEFSCHLDTERMKGEDAEYRRMLLVQNEQRQADNDQASRENASLGSSYINKRMGKKMNKELVEKKVTC